MFICGCSSASADVPAFQAMLAQTGEYPALISNRTVVLKPLLDKADALAQGYYYEEAITLLKNVPEIYANDSKVLQRIEDYKTAFASFVPYEKPVRHIFFHSLIVDTALAFDGDYMENGYNYWMTTVDEFKAILNELYANDYILIDIHNTWRNES